MRSAINLATRPFLNYRPFLAGAGLLALASLGLTVLVAYEGIQAWQERRATQAQVRELEQRRAALLEEQRELERALEDSRTRELLERARFLNRLIEQKRLSWTRLFFDLQQRLPSRVRILSLGPRLREDGLLEVELRVGGESAVALIEFLQSLEKAKEFREVMLESQAAQDATRGDAIVADISAIYLQEERP
ncbi:MAG: hypothetical protein HYY26_02595 [Acidobacteria bacterium]|nr:hypothetical protein [Acidobacteriota bacterium]